MYPTIPMDHLKKPVKPDQHTASSTTFVPATAVSCFAVQKLIGHNLALRAAPHFFQTSDCRDLPHSGHHSKHRLLVSIMGVDNPVACFLTDWHKIPPSGVFFFLALFEPTTDTFLPNSPYSYPFCLYIFCIYIYIYIKI